MIDDAEKRLAQRLRDEREQRGWSLGDLAERSGVSKAMLSKIERSEASPTAALLGRLSQVMFPLADPAVGIPALRSAIVLGMANSKNGITAVSFLQAYPSQELAISLPALLALMQKASSISDLVRFFSESPLDGLRGSGASAAPTPAPGAAPAAKTP